MTNPAQRVRYNDFSGGEASIFPYTAMPSKYSMLLQNLYVSERKTVKKVPGYEKVNSAGSAGVNLWTGFEFIKNDGTSIKLVAGGGEIFKITGDTLTPIESGLDNGEKVYFSSMNDLCIMTNGIAADGPMKYDGATVSALGGSPPATTFKTHVHKGRVWCLERDNVMLATCSSLNNPEEYTGGTSGYIDFKFILKKGDVLMDMATYVDLHVFIFKEHIAIYSGTTPTGTDANYQLVQLIEGVGAVATGCCLGMGSYFGVLYKSGLKSLKQIITTGALSVGEISDPIDPALRAQIAANPAGFYSMAHYPKLGLILMVTGDITWIYSYAWKAWSRMPSTAIQFVFVTQDGTAYFCGNNYVYKWNEALGTFDDATIATVWKTAWLQMSRNGLFVYPTVGELGILSDTKPITFAVDQWTEASTAVVGSVSATLLSGVADFDSLSPLAEDVHDHVRFPMFGRGRKMLMQVANTSNIPGFELCELVIQSIQGGF